MGATRIDEIADGILRINTAVEVPQGAFSFNQYLLLDDEPLLFHSGPRRLFPTVSAAIARVLPLARLRFVGFSHYESDECGALNPFLAAAPHAEPVCGQINAMLNADTFDRPPRALGDGEELTLGRHRVRWLDTPHLPHAWECGYLFEAATHTLLCGDLFTQPGDGARPLLTSTGILDESEAFRHQLDYYSHTAHARALLARLAATQLPSAVRKPVAASSTGPSRCLPTDACRRARSGRSRRRRWRRGAACARAPARCARRAAC